MLFHMGAVDELTSESSEEGVVRSTLSVTSEELGGLELSLNGGEVFNGESH